MFKYSRYFILTITILSLSNAIATKRGFEEDESFSSIHDLPNEVIRYTAGYLDPLSLTRLLRTNKSLRDRVREQNVDDSIKPIPFGNMEMLLQEINRFKDIESYTFIICQRLPYSFKSILGADLTWKGFPTISQKQKDAIKFLWDEVCSSSEYAASCTLRDHYRSIRSQQDQDEPDFLEIEENKQNFLKDMPERHQAITDMRPLVLLGYITESLYHHSKPFFPRMKYNPDLSFLDTLKEFLCVFKSYEVSTANKEFLNGHPGEFYLGQIDLFQAFWKAKVYHDAIGFDLTQKKQIQQKFISNLKLSFRILQKGWPTQLLLPSGHNVPCLSLRDLAQTTNSWLCDDMIEMMGSQHFSQDQPKDEFNIQAIDDINNIFGLISATYATPEMNQDPTIETHQRMAFYYAEAAELLTDFDQKAKAYTDAGEEKRKEARLWNEATDREKKIDALAQQVLYLAEAAELLTDPAQKVRAYTDASEANRYEVCFLNETTDHEKKINAWARQALYRAKAAELHTDPAQKAQAYTDAGEEKWNEAQLWNKATDREKKAIAWSQAALYRAKAAELHTDPAQKAQDFTDAGAAKSKEARLWKKATDREKKINACSQAAVYYAKAAAVPTKPNQKAQAYTDAGQAKWNEALFRNEETDREKKVIAWSQAAVYYAKAAAVSTKPAQKAQAYTNAGTAKWNEALFWNEDTHREKKINACSQAAAYYALAAAVSTKPAQKAQAYANAGAAKWNEALFWNEETDREKNAIAWSQAAVYYAKAAALFTIPDQKAQAYTNAGEAKSKEAQLWNETIDREKKINAEKQKAFYDAEAAKLRSNSSNTGE